MRETVLRNAGVHSAPDTTIGEHIEIYSIAGGEGALQTLESLWENEAELGGWPILLGARQELQHLQENLEDGPKVLPWLSQADAWRNMDVREVLRAAKEVELEHLRKYNREHPEQPAPDMLLTAIQDYIAWRPELPALDATDWPPMPADEGLSVRCLFDPFENRLHDEVLLAIINCPSTDVAAYLNFGGWNACPPPSVHVAVARLWNRKFGAVPLAITHDTIEFYVERPPTSPTEAWRLAWEHRAYSEETYGTRGDMKSVAQILWNRPHWAMWWD